MRAPRNPFRLRLAESPGSDRMFLRLFDPEVLSEALSDDQIWTRLHVFRSAAGGGKTSLLKLFTPSSLRLLWTHRKQGEEYSELVGKLKQLGAVGPHGPTTLAVLISGVAPYASIDELPLAEIQRDRLFYALIDARIILGALVGAIELLGLEFPRHLDQLHLVPLSDHGSSIPFGSNGKDVYEWAAQTERNVWNAIDSFRPMSLTNITGHDTLHSLSALRPGGLLYQDKPVAEHSVVMVDEVFRLSRRQRAGLIERVQVERPGCAVWLAERYDPLTPEEMLGKGASKGREYETPVNLGDFWGGRKASRVLRRVADKRLAVAEADDFSRFEEVLAGSLDDSRFTDAFEQAKSEIRQRLKDKVAGQEKYKALLSKPLKQGTSREQAIDLRVREIILERDKQRKQFSLDLPESGPVQLEKSTTELRSFAEYLLAVEFSGIPYYYGIERLVRLASGNVDQFLIIAGDLFEAFLSSNLRGRYGPLPLDAQHRVICHAAEERYKELRVRIPGGGQVLDFLSNLEDFLRAETLKPNAPYLGVTGFHVATEEYELLKNPEYCAKHENYGNVAEMLSVCLKHNLLRADEDRKQGEKGRTWTIFYLNRLLCAKMILPLDYGGYRQRTIPQLASMLKRVAPATENEVLDL